MLFLIATPIGNRADLSQRALDTLVSCDFLLCEDTRHSSKLLKLYGIQKKCLSYHKFSEKKFLNSILQELLEGKQVGLISDAGTPCICDPGQILVNACIERGLEVRAIPGPCSVIQALILSGFETQKFQFIGFIPKKGGEKFLKNALCFPGTTVAFESPQRLVKTLSWIDPKREVAVIRETTKAFEECRRAPAEELLSHFQKTPPKGEIVLVIQEQKLPPDLDLQDLLFALQDYFGLSLKEAIPMAAKLKKMSKSQVYREAQK